jgi:hypothetical protein
MVESLIKLSIPFQLNERLAKTAPEILFKVLLASCLSNMLGALVAFPIVLATKGLVASREGIAVRPVVTFHVLPDTGLVLEDEIGKHVL